jgi:hypothetical protein
MNLRKTAALVAATASLASFAVTLAPASEAHADTVVLGNSQKSNTGFYAWEKRGCKGKKDYVEVGELAKGIGAAGSITVPSNAGGFANPWYIIERKDHSWCWNTPTQAATAVYLDRKKAGSWSKTTANVNQPSKTQLAAEAKKFSNF